MLNPAHRRKSAFITCLIVISLLVTACGTSQPAPAKRASYTIGILSSGSNNDTVLEGFKAGMSALGYEPDKTIIYIFNGLPSSPDKLDPMAQTLVEAKVDMILSMGTPATTAAKKSTADKPIPVVFVPVVDPVQLGFVKSLTKPDGNMTGVTPGLQVHARRLEQLQRIVPKIKRIYLPYNPGDDASKVAVQTLQEVAPKLGVELVLKEVRTAEEIVALTKDMPGNIDAIFIPPGTLVGSHIDKFIAASISVKLPLSAPITSQADAGALMAYGFSQIEIGKQAARLTDRILKGAKPADLPVETAEYFLVINMKTAVSIGLPISDEMLRQAKIIR